MIVLEIVINFHMFARTQSKLQWIRLSLMIYLDAAIDNGSGSDTGLFLRHFVRKAVQVSTCRYQMAHMV